MVPSVTTVLQRFTTDWAAQLQPEAIHAACEAVGYTAWRDRVLTPVITVRTGCNQFFIKNTYTSTELLHSSVSTRDSASLLQCRVESPSTLYTITTTQRSNQDD
jgi:hypothetical protein